MLVFPCRGALPSTSGNVGPSPRFQRNSLLRRHGRTAVRPYRRERELWKRPQPVSPAMSRLWRYMSFLITRRGRPHPVREGEGTLETPSARFTRNEQAVVVYVIPDNAKRTPHPVRAHCCAPLRSERGLWKRPQPVSPAMSRVWRYLSFLITRRGRPHPYGRERELWKRPQPVSPAMGRLWRYLSFLIT